MFVKLLPAVDTVYNKFESRVGLSQPEFALLSLENSYKAQVLTEFMGLNLPMVITMALNNNTVGWSGISYIAFIVTLMMFIKNVGFMTIYLIRRVIDYDIDAKMRPRTRTPTSKLELEKFAYITAYLLDPQEECD